RMLTVRQAALRACVSESLVYRWCAEGSLPHFRVGAKGRRGKLLIKEEELDAFLDSFRGLARTPAGSPPSAPASSGSRAEPFSVLNPNRLARAWKKSR